MEFQEKKQPAVVTSWSGTYGFIQFTDGTRAYVHSSFCGGRCLKQGQHVRARREPDARNEGKWTAADVELEMDATAASDSWSDLSSELGAGTGASEELRLAAAEAEAAGAVLGVVQTWSGTYGFLSLKDGRRAYVHSSACEGIRLQVGQTLVAVIEDDPRNPGKWQATAVYPVELASSAAVSAAPAATSGEADSSGRVSGTVDKWHGVYGFISFDDGRRAYVHKSACGDSSLLDGQRVMGIIVEDATNPGKWQATDVVGVVSVDTTGRTQGVVQQWMGTYGFIAFSDGRRAYVHTADTGGVVLEEGQSVVGYVGDDPTKPGKYKATAVEVLSSVPPPASASTASWRTAAAAPRAGAAGGCRFEGEVTEWNREKRYGFATFTDGRRAYIHHSNTDGQPLAHGEVVSAILTPDAQNPEKWQAFDVRRGPAGEDGTVAEWAEDRGFGFMMLENGQRCYVHRSQLPGDCYYQGAPILTLSLGMRLRVTLKQDPRNPGKHSVDAITKVYEADESRGSWSLSHSSTPPSAPRNGRPDNAQGSKAARLSGVVTEFSARGYGFATLQDTRRVMINAADCPRGENLSQGDLITAVVVPDPKTPGKWQALQIQKVLSTSAGGAPKRQRVGDSAWAASW